MTVVHSNVDLISNRWICSVETIRVTLSKCIYSDTKSDRGDSFMINLFSIIAGLVDAMTMYVGR